MEQITETDSKERFVYSCRECKAIITIYDKDKLGSCTCGARDWVLMIFPNGKEDVAIQAMKGPAELKEKSINWLEDDYFCSWARIKPHLISKLKKSSKLYMMAHSKDTIIGKPQLICDVKQIIPLVTLTEKKDESGMIMNSFKFIDDRYDKRFDGMAKDSYDDGFYVYRVVFKDEEYLVFSKDKLDPENYTFKGMTINMGTTPQLTKELKIRSLTKVFLARECPSSVRLISKTELIEFTKYLKEKYGIDQQEFINLTFLHPDGKVYLHSQAYNLIRVAQLLSGKWEGYPLHLMNMGPLAKGKTKELEALDFKFNEDRGICEAGNSTPKVLVPSFKEKPATPGYILDCNRVALIDELMKMINNANSGSRTEDIARAALGQLNMLLEHKKRTIGSGNDNSLVTKATAKCIFATNPFPGRVMLKDHLNIIDDTTLSRMLCFVQDKEEQEFVQSNVPFNCGYTLQHIYIDRQENGEVGMDIYRGVPTKIYSTIYDNCQNFVSALDLERVRKIFLTLSDFSQEPMKSVWKGRGLHHTILLLDGLVKFRCLFKDFDDTFTAKDEDYELLEALLVRIINSWNTDLSPKQGPPVWRGGGTIIV